MSVNITIIDRKYNCQLRNGADFTTNPGTDFTSLLMTNAIEKMRLTVVVQMSVIVEATSLQQFIAQTNGPNIDLIHPFNQWQYEGFAVGDTVRVENALDNSFFNVTVLALNAGVMTVDNPGGAFFSTLSTSDGDAFSTYVFKVTTVPTSLIYRYGFSPNGFGPNNYNSPLTGEQQVFAANGINAAYTTLPYLASSQSKLATVRAKYDSSSGTGNYIHKFTVENTFQTIHFIEAWNGNYQNVTTPAEFQGSESIKLVQNLTFGSNINNNNGTKVIIDNWQDGSVGLFNQNFNAGAPDYTHISTEYTVNTFPSNEIDGDEITSVEIRIKNNAANFNDGEVVYLYHSKLPTEQEYALSGGTFEENFVFKGVRQVESAGQIDDGFIKNFEVNKDGGDPTILVLNFDIEYSAAELAYILDGSTVYLGVSVEDNGISNAEDSNRVTVHSAYTNVIRTPDIPGLVFDNQLNFFNSAQEPAIDNPSSDLRTWINTIWKVYGEFKILKEPTDGEGLNQNALLTELKVQVVAKKIGTTTFFPMPGSCYIFPNVAGLKQNVDMTIYQDVGYNIDNTLGVPATDSFNTVILTSEVPGAFQPSQLWNFQLGFEVPWRQWIANLAAENTAPEFNNPAEPNNNFNERTSNYSEILDYEIFVFASAKVRYNGIDTVYHMQSDKCVIADFDFPLIPGWVGDVKIFDANGNETDVPIVGEDNTIEITMDNPGAPLDFEQASAEIVIDVYGSSGRDYRLHSRLDWSEPQNWLKGINGTDFVDVTQIGGAPNKIVLKAIHKAEFIEEDVEYNYYGHVNWNFT